MKSLFNLSLLFATFLVVSACSKDNDDDMIDPMDDETLPRIEFFTFNSNNADHNAKVFLPESYETNSNLPVVYLLDTTEPPLFETGLDEFEQVTFATDAIPDFEAIVVSLRDIIVRDYTEYDSTHYYYGLFNDMAKYVDTNYATGSSKTLIGRGNAGGMILLGLFQESGASHEFTNFVSVDIPGSAIELANVTVINNDFPTEDKEDMKLHFSFASEHQPDQNRALINRIHNNDYPWLTFASEEYADLNHETIYPQAYKDGLAFVFGE